MNPPDFINQSYVPYIKTYKKSIAADLSIFKLHVLPDLGLLKLNEITNHHITLFLNGKIKKYKPAYCNRMIVLIGHCFNMALKWGVCGIDKNPEANIKPFKIDKISERFLSQDESVRLMKEIRSSQNTMLKYFVPIALLTGARKRELLDLAWSDVDFIHKTITFERTKSGRPRTVPLSPDAIDILKKMRSEISLFFNRRNNYVFENPKTKMPFNSIFHSWDTARKKAGLKDVRIHDLRHSFASALVNQGIPLYDVQKLLGHQSIQTTQRYAHLSDERLRSSATEANRFYCELK